MVRRGHLDRFRIQVSVSFVFTRPINSNKQLTIGLYPKSMFINRGNHEAKEMNRTYGFEGEAKHKHGEQTYKVCPACILQFEHPSQSRYFSSYSLMCLRLVSTLSSVLLDILTHLVLSASCYPCQRDAPPFHKGERDPVA